MTKPASLRTLTLLCGIFTCLLGFLLNLSADPTKAKSQLRAGAYIQDVTPPFDSLLINGGFTERRRGKMNPGDLKARCFVLEHGDTSIAIAIVDSCMIPRDVCDEAKALASKAIGIPPEKIVIAATHTHSAPSTMDYCLGTMADPAYTKFLPGKIAEGIIQAHKKLEPARIGWNQVKAPGYTYCRRWITRPDKMLTDPFDEKTVRAMMHPGFQNPNYIGPSGPADDELSVLSIQSLDGSPLGVIANFSMHYHGGGKEPADYFGLFSDRLAKQLAVDGKEPVCAMTQGTSGDLYLRDYSGPPKTSEISSYTDGLVKIAKEAAEEVEHQDNPLLGMEEKRITLGRRLPDEQRLAWADKILAPMKGQRPKNNPEVYAEQARYLHENPTEQVVLQTIRIGDLAITMTPNEVYGITGLKLKARSPFASTFNIELANGAAGYIPPPEQHALGGYNTWPARTAGLEVKAEPKIVESLLASLESLAGKPREQLSPRSDNYAKSILADKPLAYWQCEEFDGGILNDASGNNRIGRIEGSVAYYLAGPKSESFSNNNALQLVGGTVSATVPKAKSLSFWFWNGMVTNARDNTGDLVQFGDTRLRIGGKADRHSSLIIQNGDSQFSGSSKLKLHTWHHVMLTRSDNQFTLYLDGIPQPEISASISDTNFSNFRFGGFLPIEGRIDEVAWFEQSLTGEDIQRHYRASGVTRPAQPVKLGRGATKDYTNAVIASKPVAYWPLEESCENLIENAPPAAIENGLTGNTFNGGRVRAELPHFDDTYSVEFWFRNNLPNDSRAVTAYLFSRGVDGDKDAEADSLGIGGTYASSGRLIVYQGNRSKGLLSGKTELEPESWHHVVMTREGDRLRVYLNSNPTPEIDESFKRSYPENHPQFFFGGRNDNFANLNGNLDHIAVYNRVLSPREIEAHFKTVSLEKVAKADAESKPNSPLDSLKAIHVPEGYKVELVASEPLTKDPVAIDWGPDGKLWVAEMADYPSGIDGKPSGRVRFLEDLDGDGKHDKSTLFLDGLNFPAGIMSWKKGVLIAAAPDIIYAEDTTGDGKADKKEILFTGFKQGNQQLRVNGLHWGLDNWVHGANGSHYAGYAKGMKITSPKSGKTTDLGSFDFRMNPDQGIMEPLSGPSQFGRTRDDWGNSFGVQNSFPIWHYVLEQRYLGNNPDYPSPDPRRQLRPQNARVFPASKPQKRFHSFNNSGRFTSACSPMIYRDNLLFDDATHAFTCEPFHNLVQHVILKRDGYSFTAERAEGEEETDFFASEDRWCRPVMAKAGPDGALWVVDMYRYMIEHPDWLPKEGKDEMKPHERKGEEFGRIYRVVREKKSPRPIPNLAKASSEDLVKQLASSNGIIRDLAHRLLVERKAVFVSEPLSEMARSHDSPQARLHALCVLDGLLRLDDETFRFALSDSDPRIRRFALTMKSPWGQSPQLLEKAIQSLNDPDPSIQLQAACHLAILKDEKASEALIRYGSQHTNDKFIRAIVFNSALANTEQFASTLISHESLLHDLIRTPEKHNQAIRKLILAHFRAVERDQKTDPFPPGRLQQLASWLDRYPEDIVPLEAMINAARELYLKDLVPESIRADTARLLGRQEEQLEQDQQTLISFLSLPFSPIQRKASLESLIRIGSDDLPSRLFESWPTYPSATRMEIIDALLQRKLWTLATLDALEKGQISPNDFDQTRKQQLLTHKDNDIRKTAERVFKKSPVSKRKEHLDSFRPALRLQGKAKEGKTIFDQRCAVCHLPPNDQAPNGPDLRAITDRSREGLFSSILDPNQSIDPSYTGYSVTLANNTSLYGRILSENANHLTIRLLDGSDRQLARRDIKSLTNNKLSLMPEGLEAGLTHQNLADLISFLQSFGSK
ncbi:c-type cytochrome [Akkermansiaceae bacterium]|nr:c-type cytochrome [Akkermansiaceae bacterium]